MSMQEFPHDGVAALADSMPTAPTPPTTVTVTAAAKTLLLKDIDSSLRGTTAVPCVRLFVAGPRHAGNPDQDQERLTLISPDVQKGEGPARPEAQEGDGPSSCLVDPD